MTCEQCPYEDTSRCDLCEIKHPEIKHSRCPRCGGPNLRVMLNMRISVPAGHQFNLTKAKLRMKEVKLETEKAGIDVIYCDDCHYQFYPRIERIKN